MVKKKKAEFKVVVKGNFVSDDFKKEIEYHQKASGEMCKDVLEYRNQTLILSGNRTNRIDLEDDFFTVKSNYYRGIVKGLLYIYFTGEILSIDSITFITDEEKDIPFEQRNLFAKEDREHSISTELLDKMFLYNEQGDVLTRILMNIVLAKANKERKLENIWRAFNALYDWKCVTNKSEKERINAILDYIKDADNFHFKKTIKEIKKIIADRQQFSRQARVFIEGINFSDRNYSGDLDRFKERYINLQYSDPILRKKIKEMFKYYIESHSEDFDKGTKKLYENLKKEWNNQSEIATPTDFIKYFVWFVYHFRNKDFHGEYWPTNFLIENIPHKELNDYADSLELLVIDLITYKGFLD